MIENFNGIFYLIIFLVILAMNTFYGFNCLFKTQKFLEKYEVDISASFFCRFAGGMIMGAVLMQLYILSPYFAFEFFFPIQFLLIIFLILIFFL